MSLRTKILDQLERPATTSGVYSNGSIETDTSTSSIHRHRVHHHSPIVEPIDLRWPSPYFEPIDSLCLPSLNFEPIQDILIEPIDISMPSSIYPSFVPESAVSSHFSSANVPRTKSKRTSSAHSADDTSSTK